MHQHPAGLDRLARQAITVNAPISSEERTNHDHAEVCSGVNGTGPIGTRDPRGSSHRSVPERRAKPATQIPACKKSSKTLV